MMKVSSRMKSLTAVIIACASILGAASAYAADEAHYFRITKDTRTCAAPACGGVYATTMNSGVDTTCPDGTVGSTCYIGRLDTTAFGMSPFTASNGAPVKVKGTIVPGGPSVGGVRYGSLVIENVFLPVGNTTDRLMHHLYVITDNGLECNTRLCLHYNSRLANRFRDHTISSFDLTKLALTRQQGRDFRNALRTNNEVLIQVGEGQVIETENGIDMREGVNALYMPIESITK
jgi:hypothetical protein